MTKCRNILLPLAILWFLFAYRGTAQQQFHLSIELADTARQEVFESIKYKDWFRNESRINAEMRSVVNNLIAKGHLAAGFDQLHRDSLQIKAALFIGPLYRLSRISPGNADPVVLSQSGYRSRYFTDVPLNPSDLLDLYSQIIKYYEDHGYPFASVKLDSLILQQDTLSASLNLAKGPYITYDSITIKGSSKIRKSYLHNYLDIKPGQPYNESRVRRIPDRIREIPFADEIKPFEIGFTKDMARVILYLEKKKASQFDGIIGVAPNNTTTGKLLLTGDLNLSLISVFNRGETLDFRWNKNEPQTQELEVKFNLPFLFRTPFGIDYRFDLLKRDTTFLTLENHIGLEYLFRSDHKLKAFVEFMSSSLLSTEGLGEITSLPSYADVSTSFYGLEYYNSLLDYRYNPRKGLRLNGIASFGNKKIKENQAINPAVYDSLDLSNNIYRLKFDISYFIPVFRRATIMIRNQTAFLENENLFENELYRIGGFKTLRGFDEQSVYASSYAIMTAEFRFLFEQNSYFSAFWNGAWYEKNTVNEYVRDTPYGFGAGLSFQTGAGVFSVFYALGKQFDNPVDLKTAKVHFGYSSLF